MAKKRSTGLKMDQKGLTSNYVVYRPNEQKKELPTSSTYGKVVLHGLPNRKDNYESRKLHLKRKSRYHPCFSVKIKDGKSCKYPGVRQCEWPCAEDVAHADFLRLTRIVQYVIYLLYPPFPNMW